MYSLRWLRGSSLFAEVKGSDIEHAIEQLKSTTKRAAPLDGHIACKMYVRNNAPLGKSVELRGGRYGYRAVRVLQASFPGEWIFTNITRWEPLIPSKSVPIRSALFLVLTFSPEDAAMPKAQGTLRDLPPQISELRTQFPVAVIPSGCSLNFVSRRSAQPG